MALFKKKLIPLIISGRKTQTRRLHKHGWKVGHTYKIKDSYYCKGLGTIKITRRFKQRLGDISEQDAKKEGFKDRTEFMEAWIQINGSWNPDVAVTVYEFTLTGTNNQAPLGDKNVTDNRPDSVKLDPSTPPHLDTELPHIDFNWNNKSKRNLNNLAPHGDEKQ